MSSRTSFSVEATGVGRPDYSQNVSVAVEPIIRSHLARTIASFRFQYLPPIPYGVNLYGAFISFLDIDGNVTYAAPEEPKYTFYNVQTTGGSGALTGCDLMRFTAFPALLYVDTICTTFGYGEAKFNFKKGYVCVPGFSYAVTVNQYTEDPWFNASFVITGVVDELAEELLG